MWFAKNSPLEKEIVIERPNRRIPFLRNENLGSSTHVTRISMMTSEEPPPRTDPKRPRRPSSLPSLPSFSSSLHSSQTSNSECETVWDKVQNFFERNQRVVGSFFFLLFLPIALPLVIFRAVICDCLKVRRVFVLTVECMILQLQLMFEMMSCIQHSNASIEEKVEKMGRAFHFMNMFNPVHWIGMLQYYADQNKNHHTSPVKACLVDQGNQTSGCSHDTLRRKSRSKGDKSGTSANKNVHLRFVDEKYPSSEPEEDDHITPADREYDPRSSPGNTSSTSTLTNINEKDPEFKSTVNSPANDSSVAEVNESY